MKHLQYGNVTLPGGSSQMMPDPVSRAISWRSHFLFVVSSPPIRMVPEQVFILTLTTYLLNTSRGVVPTAQIRCLARVLHPDDAQCRFPQEWVTVPRYCVPADVPRPRMRQSPRLCQKEVEDVRGDTNTKQRNWQCGWALLAGFLKIVFFFFFFKIFLSRWFYYATEAVICANYLLLIA